MSDIVVQEWAQPGEPFRLVAVEVGEIHWPDYLPVAACERLVRFADPMAQARAGASEWLKYGWLPQQVQLTRVEFLSGSNGKPILAGGAAEWGFNLSHAGQYAVAVLARDADVGVDVESTRRPADCERLAQRVFSASEQACVAEGGRRTFFMLWSQKEALMKALGCGWADGKIQRRTALEPVAYQLEPATGARIWARTILDGAYTLAVAMLPR